ncbi:hypothetical protein CSC03_0232 [Enterobacter hormaechei]|nr:hypothetical protein T636_A2883 [Enterobacter hormaechei subsp. xiangfangensis]PRW21271.1 hypothetical protein CSC03_0232 [Enterobacter hormaechei]
MWRLILAAKKLLSNLISGKSVCLMILSSFCCKSKHNFMENTLQDTHFCPII